MLVRIMQNFGSKFKLGRTFFPFFSTLQLTRENYIRFFVSVFISFDNNQENYLEKKTNKNVFVLTDDIFPLMNMYF